MHPDVHCSTIYNSQDMEASQAKKDKYHMILLIYGI